MEPYLSEFLLLATVHLFGVMSPGPDFVIVLKQSVSHGRKVGIWTALGLSTGIFIHVGYTIAGIGWILSESIIAFNSVKYAGAAYLVFIGLKAIKAKKVNDAIIPNDDKIVISFKQAFVTGFLTNVLNPKVALFFLSLFSVIISSTTPLVIQVGYGFYMALATAAWFSLLSYLLGHDSVRLWFGEFGHWFERIMGGLFVALGIELAIAKI